MYDRLVRKVIPVDIKTARTSRLVTKTHHNSDKQGLKKKDGLC